MTFVKLSGEKVTKQKLKKGIHYVDVELNEVPLFIKEGKKIPLRGIAEGIFFYTSRYRIVPPSSPVATAFSAAILPPTIT